MNIINRFDDYITEEKDKIRSSHHPSDIDSCMKQMWYKWNNRKQTDPPSAGNFIKMRFGIMAEDYLLLPWLEKELEDGNIKDLKTQVEIWGEDERLEKHIHGYQDFLITNLRGQEVGIECKSSFGRGIAEIQRKGEPKPEHLLQVYLYLTFGTAEYYYLVYFGRDNGYRTQFEIKKHPEGITYNGKLKRINYNDLIGRLAAYEALRGQEGAPEREYKAAIRNGEIVSKFTRDKVDYKGDWQCSYCNWRSDCWKEELKAGCWNGKERVE